MEPPAANGVPIPCTRTAYSASALNVIEMERTSHVSACDLVDQASLALNGRSSSVGDIVDALGKAGYTPLLIIPSLALVSPLSGIPGFTSVCGMLIALVSLQQMLHRSSLWLPGWIRHASVDSDRAKRVIGWLYLPARWLDRISCDRLKGLVRYPLVLIPQALCLLCGLAMPLLELIPFTSSILGALIFVMAAGIFAGDGLLVLAGMLATTAAAGAIAVAL